MTKIAIVDDNKEQASAIELAIAEYGKIAGLSFVVDYYPSAYALDTRDSEYDLLFLDIQMPGKDGMSYAREIRARNPDVLICFTTSFAQYALKGYEVNAVDYILKPIATAEFITKFQERYDGRIPDSNNAMSYDAARIMIEGLKYSYEKEGDFVNTAIMEGIKSVKEMPLASGTITMDENGDANRDILIIGITEGGGYELIK